MAAQKSSRLPHVGHGATTTQTQAPAVQQMGAQQPTQTTGTAMGYPQQNQATAPTMPAMEEPLKPARNNQYPMQPAGQYQ